MLYKQFLLFSCLLGFALAHGGEGKPPELEYEIHEWGVFPVPRNAAWSNMDMRAEWASMPKSFYGILPDRELPYRGPVAKPVIYFHAKQPCRLNLTIRFAEGVPTVWWPAAEYPAIGEATKKDEVIREIRFAPWLVERDPKNQSTAARPPRRLSVPGGHWVETLRQVKASEVFCSAGWNRKGISDGALWDAERFIYYDGLMKLSEVPRVAPDPNGYLLQVAGAEIWHDVMLIEREADTVRVSENWGGWESALPTGEVRRVSITMRKSTDEELGTLAKDLISKLTQAGLNQDEATSMVEVWKEGLFKQEGLTLFYRVPQSTYDRWLPLKAEPAPSRIVRVGLVVHRHLEPELEARVKELIKQLGAESFDVRSSAKQRLLKIGGAAFPLIEAGTKSLDAEVSKSCQDILSELDARPISQKHLPVNQDD